VKSVSANGKKLAYQLLDEGYLAIDIRNVEPDPVDTIIELEIVK
jgi:hypothetical protein